MSQVFGRTQNDTHITFRQIVLQECYECNLSVRPYYAMLAKKVKYLLCGFTEISEVVLNWILLPKNVLKVAAMQNTTASCP